jgi:putative hydrolase of HD superfamily
MKACTEYSKYQRNQRCIRIISVTNFKGGLMNTGEIIELLKYGNQLKRTARTGWVQRGVANAESVADHSYGVVFTALVLAGLVEEPLNLADVLAMATLHDLPEALTSDIPAPAWRFLPPGVKIGSERRAMEAMVGGVDGVVDYTAPTGQLMRWWERLHAADTPEARLVSDADKLEQFLQAFTYEIQTGNRQLQEFWAVPHQFYFPQAQALCDELRRQRGG